MATGTDAWRAAEVRLDARAGRVHVAPASKPGAGVAVDVSPSQIAALAAALCPDEGGRSARIGAAVRFVERLRERGILRDDDRLEEFLVTHRIQKYAYIAHRLGARLDYTFDFLESGAYSTDLDIDLHARHRAAGGGDAFESAPRALDALADIVRDRRDTRWLQMATFAARDLQLDETRDEFAERMVGGRLGHTRRAAADAFDRVRARAADLAGSRRGAPGVGSP